MAKLVELYPRKAYKTCAYITPTAAKEFESLVEPQLAAIFEKRCENGFAGYIGPSLRPQGDGIWAFGVPSSTVRIVLYFVTDSRDLVVIGGVFKGKSGSGSSRPAKGDAVVSRTAALRDGKE